MATKDYNLSFKLHADTNFISNFDSSQFINLNLNHNNKCSKIDCSYLHSKTISNKNDERNFNNFESYHPLVKVNDFDWNKSGKQHLCSKFSERLNLYGPQDEEKNLRQWNLGESPTAKGSTLSLHIAAYENDAAGGEFDGSNSNTKSPAAAKLNTKNTTGKTWKNVKQHFVQSSSAAMSPFEIPRQQDDTTPKTPEVMQFKSSKKLLNPNGDNSKTAKAKTPEMEPPTTSAWSWIPSLFSTLFIAKPPTKKLYESSPSTQQSPPASPIQKPTSMNENRKKEFPHATTILPISPQQQPDADERCSRGNGDASPQSSAERTIKSKEMFLDPKIKKKPDDLPKPFENGATMISVNFEEEGHIADSMQKDLIPQPEAIIQKRKSIPTSPKVKDVFELEASTTSPGAVTTEPAIKPKCSFNRVSFSSSHTVYFLPNTKQKLHKKIVRSRHDAWRRYGALMVIHKRGGWSYTMNGKAKNFQKVEKDTPLPPAPVLPPILTEEEFHKRPIITTPSASRSKRQRQQQEKKENKGDTDTSVSDEDPPSC